MKSSCPGAAGRANGVADRTSIGPASISQPVDNTLSRAAIFQVATINPGDAARAAVRSLCGDLAALLRSVGFRDFEANLTCVMGFGSDAWDRLFGSPRPAELHAFREFHAANRHAISTPGDLIFHIRSKRMDLCFELAMQIATKLGSAITMLDEVHGFRYFDDRDLLGFVDGTENPRGIEANEAVLIGDEDAAFAGGSYILVQKYLHDLVGWDALTTEAQENIIGRKKLSDIELDDSVKPTSAHTALNTIVENGKEVKILRDNMPFGNVKEGEFGTYYIGYCRTPRILEKMLENMFIGNPPGNYDRILDFSRAVTGNLFFVPTASFLDDVAGDESLGATPDATPDATPAAAPDAAPVAGEHALGAPAVPAGICQARSRAPSSTSSDGSLDIGSLRGETSHE